MSDALAPRDERERRESILEILSKASGVAPSVSLPEPGSDAGSPVALDPTAEARFSERTRGSYEVLGEVARGGMGAILRGHDRDLRRDVAIKVLAPELAGRPEVVQRFVEEAQIGAQLQHPGVVPVYELGLMADERPFFTMKLVKGRTLASLLGARRSPAEELGRFVAVFEQICQTMAYAHSKGVLHRDLKPANVMVGAFGEVQVVDWGLAKVLRRGGVADEARAQREQRAERTVIETVRSGPGSSGSDSLVGSILGTPAYMPPEQARGEIDGLDERADVFALGAILCEILTGAPPYAEGGDEPVVVQAARGHLAPARARLEASKADEALVRLCVDCLAPAPQARPASAEAVARAVREHLSSTEERAQRAQLAAAEARVRTAEAEKRRRLTVALAGALVALLAAVGGGYLWIERQAERRRADARREIDGMQASALALQGEGEHDEALAAARSALERARELDAGGELDARLAAFVADVEAKAGAARAAAELEARNRALFARLDEIELLGSGVGVSTTNSDVDRAYAEAFRAYGLDVEAEDLVATLAALRERGLGLELALALDQWARVKRALSGPGAEGPEALTALAADLDPDPRRTEVRAALLRQDRDALFAMLRDFDAGEEPPATVWVVASAVEDVKGDARTLLERAVAAHPDDARFRTLLGTELSEARHYGLARLHLEAAHALQPENLSVADKLANALEEFGDYPGGARLRGEILARVPEFADGWRALGFDLLMLGAHDDAVAAYERADGIAPPTITQRAEAAAGRYLAGRIDAAELEAALDALGPRTLYAQQIACWALCSRPGAPREHLERALRILEEILPISGTGWLTSYCHALASLRLERWADCLAAFGPEHDVYRRIDVVMSAAAMRAVALQRLGRFPEARAQLADAEFAFTAVQGAATGAWERSPFFALLEEARSCVR